VSRTFYFAYGSNMDGSTLRGRRGVEWSRAAPALARGWRLALDKPSLLGTAGAMARIAPDPSSEVWGVLYEIATSDYEHIEFTEGVLIEHYRRSPIVVAPTHSWDLPEVDALTLTSEKNDASLRPSVRYLDLLITGAAEHGLPATWIESLRAIDAIPESPEFESMRSVFDHVLRRGE
jgi:hypothetical protein